MDREQFDLELRALKASEGFHGGRLHYLKELLDLAPFGIPITRLCILMGLHPSDWKQLWVYLREVSERFHVKISRYGSGEGVIFLESRYSAYGRKVSALVKEAVKSGALSPSFNRAEVNAHISEGLSANALQVYHHRMASLWEQLRYETFTYQDVQQTLGLKPAASRRLVKNLVEDGFAKIVKTGKRGRGGQSQIRITNKMAAMLLDPKAR